MKPHEMGHEMGLVGTAGANRNRPAQTRRRARGVIEHIRLDAGASALIMAWRIDMDRPILDVRSAGRGVIDHARLRWEAAMGRVLAAQTRGAALSSLQITSDAYPATCR